MSEVAILLFCVEAYQIHAAFPVSKKNFLGQSSSNTHKLPSLPLLWHSPAVVSAIEPVPVLKLGPRFPPADKHLSSANPTYPKLKKKIQSSPEKVVVSVELFVVFPFLAQIHLEIKMIINLFYLLILAIAVVRAIIIIIFMTIIIIIFVSCRNDDRQHHLRFVQQWSSIFANSWSACKKTN